MDDNRGAGGISFGLALFLLFLGLKLGHVITWSWWWVTSPLWLPLALALAFGLVVRTIGTALDVSGERRYERERLERERLARSADLAIYDEWGKPRG
jgi:hypothetical protein